LGWYGDEIYSAVRFGRASLSCRIVWDNDTTEKRDGESTNLPSLAQFFFLSPVENREL
jgi:hypothetical protein